MLRRAIGIGIVSVCAAASVAACGDGDDANGTTTSTSDSGTNDGANGSDGTTTSNDASITKIDGGLPAGWLYTNGGKIFESSGGGTDTQWMGRGVNMDDLFLCGFNNTFTNASADDDLKAVVTGLLTDWKPTFVRVSLSMKSYVTESWIGTSAYKTQMTDIIHMLGANPDTYVLVTLRTDASMILQDPGNPEATNVPSNSTNTPDAANFPTGTDAVYQALVDTFANDKFVLFGLSNEPGGNTITKEVLVPALTHAAQTIRAEEDKLGVPHHLISVQGTGYSGKIDFYSTTPLAIDDVVYELHGYPPASADYTFTNIPVILGEYGPGGTADLPSSAAFYADLESKQIPNLAWDFEPYSDCSPDLLSTSNPSTLAPTTWGTTVKTYLDSH